MAKRLQVILQDPEYREIQRVARSHQMTIADWERQTLSEARRNEPLGDVEDKLASVGTAVRHEFPVRDIDTMLGQIERGYRAGLEP